MNGVIRKLILFGLDLILINLAYLFALLIRFEGFIGVPYLEAFWSSMPYFTGITLFLFWLMGLYNSLWRYASINEFMNLVITTSISFIFHYALTLKMEWEIPRSVFFIAWMLTVLAVTGSRFSYRIIRRFLRNIHKCVIKPKRVLIVGAGDAGAGIVREMQLNNTASYIPVALIDDADYKRHTKIHNVPVKGSVSDIPSVVELNAIDEIIIAMPRVSKARIKEILLVCQSTPCKLRMLPSLSDIFNNKATLSQVRDVEITDLLGRPEVVLDVSGIEAYIKDQVVLITGGGGSIGSELCRQLIKFKPKQLLILDIYENNAYDLQQSLSRQYPDAFIKVIIASVRDKARIDDIFKRYQPAIVFHAAAHKHVPLMEANPSEAIKNNVFGTLNVAQCASDNGVKRFILISTDKAVNPTNIMGATKRVCELIIQSIDSVSETEFVAVRFGNVLGSNGSVIPLFKSQIAEGGPVTLTHPDITRYFMTIPEASRLVIQAGALAKGGEIFVLDMGEPVKILDLATQLIRLSGLRPEIDIPIQFVGLRPGEKLYEELLLEEEGLMCTLQEGILIAKPSDIDYETLVTTIDKLRENLFDTDHIKTTLSELVPSLKAVE